MTNTPPATDDSDDPDEIATVPVFWGALEVPRFKLPVEPNKLPPVTTLISPLIPEPIDSPDKISIAPAIAPDEEVTPLASRIFPPSDSTEFPPLRSILPGNLTAVPTDTIKSPLEVEVPDPVDIRMSPPLLPDPLSTFTAPPSPTMFEEAALTITSAPFDSPFPDITRTSPATSATLFPDATDTVPDKPA